MKKINIFAAALFSASLLLASCGGSEYGENAEMPPESQVSDTQETGVEISGDKSGTGADSAHINDKLAGDSVVQQ
ncbi:hypothetical protein [Pontibacter cellulosilyticus]|uniref:Uncharacterized protein n=1 Tax=Pontibacter cellulosilyticus TaxID=1720253 RepID=A0A923N9Z7_9BACT|nr:hypothetical protein [Pontibacter cellulosilyticus]MBC5993140.1 hypothetical protein [Pontibacter cellulosilyticus]